MSNSKIAQALTTLFDKQRIVFWYDTQCEFRAEFDSLELNNVEKIEILNNELGIKYRVTRQQPTQSFLLYYEGNEPPHADNWLLDLQLASGEIFRTDQASLWLAELGLTPDCYPLLQQHKGFFYSQKRCTALRELLQTGDSDNQLRLKMLAICCHTAPRLDVILEALLAELAREEEAAFKLIKTSQLDAFLWEQIKRTYGYRSEKPELLDFIIELFKEGFLSKISTDYTIQLSAEALVFLHRWKDSRIHENSFKVLSEYCAEILQISDKLHAMDYRILMGLDYFELIDRKIISELVRAIVAQLVSATEVESWIRQRRQSCWFERFKDVYLALEQASQFLQLLSESTLEMDSLADGITQYAQQWFRIDQRYRKFIYHARVSGQISLLETLNQQIENQYNNNFLTRLNNRWQRYVDAAEYWNAAPILRQQDFFARCVKPFIERNTKVCVIISDAFRYEIGEELQNLIRRENRFDAGLEPALSALPSYTQLGMAALLPGQTVQLAENESGDALVDGQSAKGTLNRGKILKATAPNSATLLAKDLFGLNHTEARALIRDHDVIYVYHNLIDKTGDTRDTEERVFAAAEETLSELLSIIKKLTNANASNLLITADHGFIYQNHPLEESDFLSGEPEGNEVLYRDRRFILGRGLRNQSSFKTFTPQQLGLAGTLDVQIPKSINRLRLKGSGSRFVHGGATLQEVVIPIIRVNKKRLNDVEQVDVEIISGNNQIITTGQLAVVFYQTEAVTEKRKPRHLYAGLYTVEGTLISNRHDINFDFTSENPRDREHTARFILSRIADDSNNQAVELRIEEAIEKTSSFKLYKTVRYTIRRSFTSEFDF